MVQTVFNKLTALEKDTFNRILNKIEFKKNDVLIEENTIANKIFLIEKGSCRSFFIKDGNDITDFFFFENSFATDFASYCGNKPSQLNLICLEDSVVYEIKKTDLEQLYTTSIAFSEVGRVMAEYSFLQIEERMRLLHTESLETKYNWMLQNFPSIFQRVNQYHIASFLGVKPQSLSRIRAKISGKNY